MVMYVMQMLTYATKRKRNLVSKESEELDAPKYMFLAP
jgi:hypothetical protein